mmetsp:Transcript_14391/g.16349  ORF Transcript_14391/g.16349 Transcript_14391/m.16349 type:complete len:169 (-) Transcript_14391:543-1049(-)
MFVSSISTLTKLNLRSTCINQNGVKFLKSLKCLQVLHLNGNSSQRHVGDESCFHTSEIKSLREIEFELSGLTNVGVKHLSHLPLLENLYVKGNRIGDIGCSHLSRCKKLSVLDITFHQISDTGIQALLVSRSLQHICFYGNLCSPLVVGQVEKKLPVHDSAGLRDFYL